MDIIDSKNVTDEQAQAVYESDKQAFDDFTSGRTNQMDFSTIQRLITSEMVLNKSFRPNKICGYTRDRIKHICESPEHYARDLLRLMDYMYQRSGYMKRLVDYFSNMPVLNYYVDTEALDIGFFNVKPGRLKKTYLSYSAECGKFNLSNQVHDIYKRLYLHDICYAYIVETDYDMSYYYLDPHWCRISKVVNGNVFQFAVDRSLLTNAEIDSLPEGLRTILMDSWETQKNNLVDIPIEQSLCIKYNNNFLHIFPPLFPMIASILLVEDYEDIAKSKAINDAYKLLVLHIPTKDGQVTMDDKMMMPYVRTALSVVQQNIGVLPYPDEVQSVQFSATNADDRDKVSDAISQMYTEMGVSESLMSGATSGSELKQSITNDAGDIYRIYRQIENWVNLQMKLRDYLYKSYQFTYKIMDMTIFNKSDIIDSELKLAQASLPNKNRLMASAGFNPNAVIGNTAIEDMVFKDVFDMWMPLKSSYTTSGDTTGDDVGGRPEMDDTEITEITQTTRDNDGNDPDNRV